MEARPLPKTAGAPRRPPCNDWRGHSARQRNIPAVLGGGDSPGRPEARGQKWGGGGGGRKSPAKHRRCAPSLHQKCPWGKYSLRLIKEKKKHALRALSAPPPRDLPPDLAAEAAKPRGWASGERFLCLSPGESVPKWKKLACKVISDSRLRQSTRREYLTVGKNVQAAWDQVI